MKTLALCHTRVSSVLHLTEPFDWCFEFPCFVAYLWLPLLFLINQLSRRPIVAAGPRLALEHIVLLWTFVIRVWVLMLFWDSSESSPQYCFLQWKGHLVWIRREVCTDQARCTIVQIKSWVDFDVRGRQQGWTFSLEKALLWIIHPYFSPKQWFDIKNILKMDLFLTNRQLSSSNWWTVVVWIIVMFLSAVWILTAPIHYRGSIGEQVMECYISQNAF